MTVDIISSQSNEPLHQDSHLSAKVRCRIGRSTTPRICWFFNAGVITHHFGLSSEEVFQDFPKSSSNLQGNQNYLPATASHTSHKKGCRCVRPNCPYGSMDNSSEVAVHVGPLRSAPETMLPGLWASFFLAILLAASMDVCYISRPSNSCPSYVKQIIFWICCGFAFSGLVLMMAGWSAAGNWIYGYFLEYMLLVGNFNRFDPFCIFRFSILICYEAS